MKWDDGDIYFWTWKNIGERGLDPYWCCAQKAVVRNGKLVDEFTTGMYAKYWTSEEAQEQLYLEYKGNFSELEKLEDWKIDYYRGEDIIDLRHANSTRNNIYLRKGAKRDKEKILAMVRYYREKTEAEKSTADFRLERLRKTEEDILSGIDLEKVYIP